MLTGLLKMCCGLALISGCAQSIGGLSNGDGREDVGGGTSDMGQPCGGDACTTPGPECVTSADCASGQGCLGGRCQSGVGTCMATTDCDDGQFCVDGLCRVQAGCMATTDCDPGQTCVDGVCEEDAPCSYLGDCAPGEVCASQACVAFQGCERIAGPSRYETAVEVSKRFYPDGAEAVVLVVDQASAPDGLSAGPLAFAKNGPILYTGSASLPASTRSEINRLQPTVVYILGGATVISSEVESALRTDGHGTQRVAGDSRFSTAAAVAALVGGGSLAVVASGDEAHFVDGLVASAAAARVGAPVLLVSADSVPPATNDALVALGITRTLVPGGSDVVSDAVLSSLPNPTRISGATRYDTAAAIAEWAATEGPASPARFVTGGDAVLDMIPATAGGSPILLAGADGLPAPTAAALGAASSALIVGGTAAVSDATKTAVCDALSP